MFDSYSGHGGRGHKNISFIPLTAGEAPKVFTGFRYTDRFPLSRGFLGRRNFLVQGLPDRIVRGNELLLHRFCAFPGTAPENIPGKANGFRWFWLLVLIHGILLAQRVS
jgi:hypothetical protein